MKRLESPIAVLSGVVLIVVANALILGAAHRNRRGEPLAELMLTERELALPVAKEEESSALFLSLVLGDRAPLTVTRAARARGSPLLPPEHPWLDREKLRSLGFRLAFDPSDPRAEEACEQEGSARVFVVLELEGEAWRRFLGQREEKLAGLRRGAAEGTVSKKELEDAETLLRVDQTMRSRLMPIDAGRDLPALTGRYTDRRRHAILPGVIGVFLDRGEGRPPAFGTRISLVVDEIQVPRELHPLLDPFLPRETFEESFSRLRRNPAWPVPSEPRYRARLGVGRHNEAWLLSLEAGPGSNGG